jgi:hypothetical protein
MHLREAGIDLSIPVAIAGLEDHEKWAKSFLRNQLTIDAAAHSERCKKIGYTAFRYWGPHIRVCEYASLLSGSPEGNGTTRF